MSTDIDVKFSVTQILLWRILKSADSSVTKKKKNRKVKSHIWVSLDGHVQFFGLQSGWWAEEENLNPINFLTCQEIHTKAL